MATASRLAEVGLAGKVIDLVHSANIRLKEERLDLSDIERKKRAWILAARTQERCTVSILCAAARD